MVELDFFKSKLISYLREYSPDLVDEKERIEKWSDAAYDELNRQVQLGITRHEAQDSALEQMLSSIPDTGYMRMENLYEENFNPHSNTEGLPVLSTLTRRETILSLLAVWPEYSSEVPDSVCIERIISFTGEEG